ncbi:hypothetical protein [Halorussus lipolyticus]|uniref:hypothetical protein n=1 Tax=Halorussus lipolyticus TaxID=3034024 RepID=UPI0023E8A3B5|nr:hypothetical protein [Halorussus sp. DT80]
MGVRTNPFLLMAGLYLTVGALAVGGKLAAETGTLDALTRLRWLTIHFVTIGAMTQALFGSLPNLAASVGKSKTPPARSRWLQWLTLNASYPVVLLGMATGALTTAAVGATGVLIALALLVASVYRTDGSNSARDAADEGLLRYYALAPWFLGVGILAAFGMLLNLHGPGGYFGSLEAHVHANVWGFLALVAGGTLLAVVPALADAELRYPRLVPVTFWGVTFGASGLIAGPWLAVNSLTMAGLAVYVVGTLALLANLVGTWRADGCQKDARFAHVVGAYVWLVFPVPWAPLVLLVPETVPAAGIEAAAIEGLVFGWMLQLAMGLLPSVVVALRETPGDLRASIGEAAHRPSWLGVVAVNAGMLALWATAFPAFGAVEELLTLGGYALVGLAWLWFLPGLWRALLGEEESGRGTDRGQDADRVADGTESLSD